MPLYDFACSTCDTIIEWRCSISERENQRCAICNNALSPLFSPNTNVFIPIAFGYGFSDLYGTSSEKEFLRSNPDLIPHGEAQNIKSRKDVIRERAEQADKEVANIERAMKANKTLTNTNKRKKSND